MVAKVLRGEGEGPAPAFAGQPRRQKPMRPWRGVSSGESARWCGRGPGRVRRHLGQLGMELRELLMAETTAFGVGVDPARITLAAGTATVGRQLRPRRTGHRSATLGSGTGLRPGRPDPGTTRRPFRKSFYKMRSVMIVQSRSRYGSHPWPRRPVPGSLPVGPGHDQWSAGQKNGLRGGLPSPVLPGSGPGGRRSASELSPASQPFLPAPGLPGTPFGLAPSITSQTIFTLHGAHDGRLGPKAPACTGQTSWLRRKLRQRSGPVPGARYGVPGRQPQTRPAPHSPASGGSPPPRGTAAFMLPGSRPQDHSLAVTVSGLLRIERFSDTARTGPGLDSRQAATRTRKVLRIRGVLTTPAMPFPVRSDGGADPGRHRRRRPGRPARPRVVLTTPPRTEGYEKLLLAVLGQERASLRRGAASQRSPVPRARLMLTVSSSTRTGHHPPAADRHTQAKSCQPPLTCPRRVASNRPPAFRIRSMRWRLVPPPCHDMATRGTGLAIGRLRAGRRDGSARVMSAGGSCSTWPDPASGRRL